MTLLRFQVRSAVAAGVTLGAAALGGLVFALAGLPAAWISGALVVTIALAVGGVQIAVPEWTRVLAFIVLGTSMGTALTPETFARAATWPVSMACLAGSVLGTIAGGMLFLSRVAGWSRETAFWASAPGAFGTVIAMAADTHADLRKVAFAQALRLFLLVAALPNVLAAVGLAAGGCRRRRMSRALRRWACCSRCAAAPAFSPPGSGCREASSSGRWPGARPFTPSP
ncbi:AbrB family transcriptional regulator [Xanthobacter dioxanivorans]|uniref:AbrB family transcriptional regulator n=1 Tax=Xanthobacter dioxanivorans TaxID=2528964 RepID=UPI0038CDACE3